MKSFKLTLLSGMVLAAMSGTALAHGTMSYPKARVLHCYDGSQSEGCKIYREQGGNIYDWREVWQTPGGEATFPTTPGDRICDGGTKNSHRALNALAQWPVTTLKPDANGNVTFKWHHTAVHRTKSMQFFVTKMPYDSTKPLKFSDLEKFCEHRDFTPEGGNHHQEYSCKLPAGKTGRHLIVSVWNTNHVGDGVSSGESYRACGDVNIEGNTTVNLPSDMGSLYSIGQPVAGDSLVWRLTDPKNNGVYLEQKRVQLDQNAIVGERWTKALADAVNSSSQRVRVGQLSADGKTVTAVEGIEKSKVYAIDGGKYHFAVTKEAAEVEVEQPPPPVPAPPVAKISGPTEAGPMELVTLSASGSTGQGLKFEWSGDDLPIQASGNTASFTAPPMAKDHNVTFRVKVTDERGRSATASHVVKLKAQQSAGSEHPQYQAGTTYQAGDKVTNDGKTYECKPWPYTGWCSQAPFYYEPGRGLAWSEAWNLVK